ncbi:MAG TPA: luciferase family protein [Terriglobales bacterium]|nr:luciferase family protein [Terriglobales bacterium]
MEYSKKLEEEMSVWPDVSVHPHRFGGREFRFGNAEVGHVHTGGMVDIPFPRPVRDALLDQGLAEEHHWVPNSGWVSFRIRSDKDLQHALWLMRLSLLRYLLKTAADPRRLLDGESEALRLSPRFKSLLEPFLKTTKPTSTDPVPA